MKPIKEVDISGTWSFTPENGVKTQIEVPGGGWLKQGFACEAGTYETYITIPDSGCPQVTMLELGAVNHLAEYYIGKNEKTLIKVYEEVTAFTGQKVDLTRYVTPNETYLLKIFVRAWKEDRPVAPHWAEWCECIARGIFRDAWIRIYPEIYISNIFIRTIVNADLSETINNSSNGACCSNSNGTNCDDINGACCNSSNGTNCDDINGANRNSINNLYCDCSNDVCYDNDACYGDSSIEYEVEVTNTSKAAKNLIITGELSSWNGDSFKYPILSNAAFFICAGESKKIKVEPICWTPGKDSWWWPNVPYREGYRAKLHVLSLSIKEGQEVIHSVVTRFGFREIRQSGNHFKLNGVRVNFRGDNLQVANYDRIDYGGKGDAIDTYPGFLPPSDENPGWPKAVDNFLKLNYNIQREHMGPWTPYMIDTCDEMGLMLIGESACRWDGFDMDNGRGFHEVKCLKDIIERDKNHPSIIRWSVKNEPQCLDPEYHEELYEAVRSIDDTRPISEDIVISDWEVFDVSRVFSRIKDKPDFTWIDHYITYNAEGKPYFTTINNNDAVMPMADRPYGLGEADWMRSSTRAGLVWFATTIALVRAQGASDVRPYVLLSSWASSIPGVRTTDFMTEENRYPVHGEDNLPEPWKNEGIKLLQKACNPMLSMDVDFWKTNRESNAWGHFPVVSPQVKANSEILREITVFNDEFRGSDFELCWNVKEGSTSNRSYDSGELECVVEPGCSKKIDIKFKTPVFNTFIFLTLIVKKDGMERFSDESTCYEIVDGEDFKPVFNGEERKFI